MIKIETTVFPEPGATVTHTTQFKTHEYDDYIDEELDLHLLWAEETLQTAEALIELTMVPVAGDYIIIESVGGHVGGITGVAKVYYLEDHVDICPGGDGYGG